MQPRMPNVGSILAASFSASWMVCAAQRSDRSPSSRLVADTKLLPPSVTTAMTCAKVAGGGMASTMPFAMTAPVCGAASGMQAATSACSLQSQSM